MMEKLFQVKLIFILCITIIIVPAQSSTVENRWKIYSVQPDTEGKVQSLRRWQSNAELDFFGAVHLNQSVAIMVSEAVVGKFEQELAENEMMNHILVNDVEEHTQAERVKSPKMKRSVLTTASEFTFDHYWSYEEINLYLNMLSKTFANMTTLTTVGYSAEDREILALEISFSDKANKSVIYMDSGMVAREKAGPMTLLYLIRELVENWSNNINFLQDVDWVIVPLLNPDGLAYAQNVHQYWAKSRAVIPGSECRGVHLNRNFDSNWMEKGSSNDVSSNVNFAGLEPMSEPESAAIDLLLNVYYFDRVKVSVNIHASGSFLLYPFFRSEDEFSLKQRDLQSLGMSFVNTIRASDRPFYIGHGGEIGGELSGVSTDYAHETVGIPYTYKILLPEGGQYGFDYPARQLERLCRDMYYGFLVFGRFVRDNYKPT